MRSFQLRAVTLVLAGGFLTIGVLLPTALAKGTACPKGYQLRSVDPWLQQAMRRCQVRLMRLATETDLSARFRCRTRFA
jgi:hypothetical protein